MAGRKRTQAGTGCVLERQSKRNGVTYQIRWRVNGGPAHYETVGADRKEAEQALALKLAEINRGTHRERRVATFHEFASEWFAGHRSHLRPSAVERVRNVLEVHLVPFVGEYLADQIGPELIERYAAEKVDERKAGERRIAESSRRSSAGRPATGSRSGGSGGGSRPREGSVV